MGASIHQHIEVKDLNGKWHHYAAPHIYRNYAYFALLAGVRGSLQPIVAPRGLPTDASFVTLHDYEYDKHDSFGPKHVGWLNADEIIRLQERLNDYYAGQGLSRQEADLEDNFFHTFIGQSSVALHKGWEDVRLIFWFDE